MIKESKLRRLALSLLALDSDAISAATLSDADWVRLDAILAEHRLQPLLHAEWSLSADRTSIPHLILERWKIAHREAGLRALVVRSVLVEATRRLAKAGISCVALKGSSLAWQCYPAAAMRPMRDVDLLVQPDATLEAWRILRAAGFCAPHGEPTLQSLRHDKHLPPLVSDSRVVIELHNRIWENDLQAGHPMPRPRDADMMVRAQMGQDGIAVPAHNDMLVHLLVHAVHSHWLDAGPLLLADIDFVLRDAQPDWHAFWAEAEMEGWALAAGLVFTLVDRWRRPGLLQRSQCPVSVPPAILEAAPDLLLQSLSRRSGARMITRLHHEGLTVLGLRKVREMATRPRFALAAAGRQMCQLAATLGNGASRSKTDAMTTLGAWLYK